MLQKQNVLRKLQLVKGFFLNQTLIYYINTNINKSITFVSLLTPNSGCWIFTAFAEFYCFAIYSLEALGAEPNERF